MARSSRSSASFGAHVWNDQGKTVAAKVTGTRKMFVSMLGSMCKGWILKKKRYRNLHRGNHEVYCKEVPRSKLVGDYFSPDANGHYRQSSLALEGVEHEDMVVGVCDGPRYGPHLRLPLLHPASSKWPRQELYRFHPLRSP